MIFRKRPRNERWETIAKRQVRRDILMGIISLPAGFACLYMWCAL